MEKFEVSTWRIWRFLAKIGAILLFIAVLVTVVNVILRAFGAPILGSTEIIRYLSMVGAALALADNEYGDGNIRVNIIEEIVPPKVRDIIGFVAYTLLAGGFFFVCYYLLQYSLRLREKGDVTMELAMPSWIFAMILTVGVLVLALSGLVKAIVRGHCLFTGLDYEEHKAEIKGKVNGSQE